MPASEPSGINEAMEYSLLAPVIGSFIGVFLLSTLVMSRLNEALAEGRLSTAREQRGMRDAKEQPDAHPFPVPAESAPPKPREASSAEPRMETKQANQKRPSQAKTAEPTNTDYLSQELTAKLQNGNVVDYVPAFCSETDVLVLEFEGRKQDEPRITISSMRGRNAALIRANGHPITLVEGSSDLNKSNIRVVMSEEPAKPAPKQPRKMNETAHNQNTQTGNLFTALGFSAHCLQEQKNLSSNVEYVSDFDPEKDKIEVVYDASTIKNPKVSLIKFPDGTGADVVVNGQVLLSVEGAQEVRPEAVVLREAS